RSSVSPSGGLSEPPGQAVVPSGDSGRRNAALPLATATRSAAQSTCGVGDEAPVSSTSSTVSLLLPLPVRSPAAAALGSIVRRNTSGQLVDGVAGLESRSQSAVSLGTTLSAAVLQTIARPSRDITAERVSAFVVPPDAVRVTCLVVPASRSRRKY